MPLPYRTILNLPSGTDLVALAERQIQEWIETKKKVEAGRRGGFITGKYFERGVHQLGRTTSLQVVHADTPQDGTRRRLLRFLERTRKGTWQVDVVVLDKPGAGRNGSDTLVVEASRVDLPDADGQVDPPQIVKQLLAELEVRDGATPVTAQSRLIRPVDIGLVETAILDPYRTVSVIVAAALDRDSSTLANLQRVVDSLTSKLVGTVSVFVLSFDALTALNESLPPAHQLQPGRVRTYMPRVDLQDPTDGRRHRILGPLTLARAIRPGQKVDRRLQEAFALQTRGAQLKTPLVRDLQRNWASLSNELAELLREETIRAAVVERRDEIELPAKKAEYSVFERLVAFAQRVLGVDTQLEAAHVSALHERWEGIELAASAIQADLRASEQSLVQANDRYAVLYEEHEYRGLELADAEKRAGALDSEVRWLRRELASSGSPAAFAAADTEIWDAPDDLDELALLLSPGVTDRPELVARVEFVGDPKDVSEARAQDLTGLDAQRVWGFVRALHDYAIARASGDAVGNLHACLRSDSYTGFKVPHTRHSPGETEQTLNQWADERTFAVPGLGPILMPAHFKSGKFVRLHYFDDTAPGGSGKIYIGYIGLHLTNTKTRNM